MLPGYEAASEDKIREWLENKDCLQDLVTAEPFISGFEWPSIITINCSLVSKKTMDEEPSLFEKTYKPSADTVMRTVSTIVNLELRDIMIDVEIDPNYGEIRARRDLGRKVSEATTHKRYRRHSYPGSTIDLPALTIPLFPRLKT